MPHQSIIPLFPLFHHSKPMRTMRNEANFPRGGPSWEPIVQNEPNFARLGQGPDGLIAQNEPNFGELAGGRNTQHSTILSFHHSSQMPVVQNKANFGRSLKLEVSSLSSQGNLGLLVFEGRVRYAQAGSNECDPMGFLM